MIQTIELENFQSHKRTKLSFDNGVNGIVGQSDSGKTAVLRALRWVIYNRPMGDAFQSHWANHVRVTITTSEGNVITRYKDKSSNYYELDGTRFDAIKSDVPDEIQKLLNIDHINIQQQLDKPFLLDSSPGEVAQHFNKVARLDMIDTSMKTIQQSIRALTQTISSNEDRQKTLEEDLEGFKYLTDIEVRVNELEVMQRNVNMLKDTRTNLEALCERIVDVEEELEQYEKILAFEKPVLNVIGLVEKRAKLDETRENLSGIITRIVKTDEDLKEVSEELEGLKKQFHDSFPNVCPLCGQKVEKGGIVNGQTQR